MNNEPCTHVPGPPEEERILGVEFIIFITRYCAKCGQLLDIKRVDHER